MSSKCIIKKTLTPSCCSGYHAIVLQPLGFCAFILRHIRHSNRCGYVGVPPDHPLYGVGRFSKQVTDNIYNNIPYSGTGNYSVLSNDLWWFGFREMQYDYEELDYTAIGCMMLAERLKEYEVSLDDIGAKP